MARWKTPREMSLIAVSLLWEMERIQLDFRLRDGDWRQIRCRLHANIGFEIEVALRCVCVGNMVRFCCSLRLVVVLKLGIATVYLWKLPEWNLRRSGCVTSDSSQALGDALMHEICYGVESYRLE